MAATGPEGSPGTRERILEAALELFTERGYDKTSVREVAERVGITKAALYYHFPSKGSLLSSLVERVHGLGNHGLDLIPMPGRLPEPEELAATVLRAIDTVLAQRPIFVLLERNRTAVEALGGESAEHREAHRRMQERWLAYVGDGSLPLRRRVRFVAAVGAILGGAIATVRGLGADEPRGLRRELAEAAFDLLEIPAGARPRLGDGGPAANSTRAAARSGGGAAR